MHSRMAALITIGAVTIGTGATAAAQADEPISGFTPEHSAAQRQAERSFQQAISANDIGRFSRTVSQRPQLIGSPGNREAFRHSVDTLRGYGLRVRRASYDVYISRPERIQVTMTKPYRREAPRFQEETMPFWSCEKMASLDCSTCVTSSRFFSSLRCSEPSRDSMFSAMMLNARMHWAVSGGPVSKIRTA